MIGDVLRITNVWFLWNLIYNCNYVFIKLCHHVRFAFFGLSFLFHICLWPLGTAEFPVLQVLDVCSARSLRQPMAQGNRGFQEGATTSATPRNSYNWIERFKPHFLHEILPFPSFTISFCYYLPWSRWLPLVNVLTSPPLLIPIRQDAGHDFAFEMPEEVCKPKPQAEVPQAWKRQKNNL